LESDTLDSAPNNAGKGLATFLEKALEMSGTETDTLSCEDIF